MSTLKATNLQAGQSATAANNFVLRSPDDGTFRLSRGNSGATTVDAMTIDVSNKLILAADASSALGAVTKQQLEAHVLAAFSDSSKTTNGWQRLPSGLILQWAVATVATGGTVSFPIAFPNATLHCITFHEQGTGSLATGAGWPTKTGVIVNHASSAGVLQTIGIFAIGY